MGKKVVIGIFFTIALCVYASLYVYMHGNFLAHYSAKMISALRIQTAKKHILSTMKLHEQEFIDHGIIVGQRRRNRTRAICESLFNVKQVEGSLSTKLWLQNGFSKPRVFYSDKHKLLVCDTPKCASTEWRNLVLIEENLIHFNTSSQVVEAGIDPFNLAASKRYMWRVFKPQSSPDHLNKTDTMLNDYFKVMTVREPLERLVSAYKDKLEWNEEPFYAGVSKGIHKKYGNGTNGFATFSEFVELILQTKNPANLDPHWMPYSYLCDPCRMKYDYIAKLETIYDDVSYLAQKIGFNRSILLDDSKKKSLRRKWDSKYFPYYKQLVPAKRQAIFEYYKPQYDLFGYTYPNMTF